MYLPKADVYNALASTNVRVLQGSQATIATLPTITFYVSDNDLDLNLDNDINSQFVQVTIDIWAGNAGQADSLLAEIEPKMRALGYRMSFCSDIPDPQNIARINTRFEGIKTN